MADQPKQEQPPVLYHVLLALRDPDEDELDPVRPRACVTTLLADVPTDQPACPPARPPADRTRRSNVVSCTAPS